MHFEEESIIYIWSKFQLDTCLFDSNILLTKFGPGFWYRIPGIGSGFYFFPFNRMLHWFFPTLPARQQTSCLWRLRHNSDSDRWRLSLFRFVCTPNNLAAGHTETSERYRSIEMLGKEKGYAVSTCQMQYDANNKETDKKINASYSLEGTVLENVESIKYNLGVTITNDLRWNIHMSAIFALRLIGPLASWDEIFTLVYKR